MKSLNYLEPFCVGLTFLLFGLNAKLTSPKKLEFIKDVWMEHTRPSLISNLCLESCTIIFFVHPKVFWDRPIKCHSNEPLNAFDNRIVWQNRMIIRGGGQINEGGIGLKIHWEKWTWHALKLKEKSNLPLSKLTICPLAFWQTCLWITNNQTALVDHV